MTVLSLASLLGWGVFVGAVFSTIGAAGGILASFGLITLFGLVDPNSVKPTAQLLVLAATVTLVPGYFRHSRLVVPLGLLLGLGGLLGAYAGSTVSSVYLSEMNTFRPLFGGLTLVIAAQIFWKFYRNQSGVRSTIGRPAENEDQKVSDVSTSFRVVKFSFAGKCYTVSTWSPILAGGAIAMTASAFGVGGGFLLVPYMASFLAMPMHIVPATAAVAIFISLIVSISNFLALGASLDYDLLLPLAVGVILGAIAGPFINRASRNSWLQVTMGAIIAIIGLKYTLV